MNTPCEIRQYSDLTRCEECRLAWDTNDEFPPECPYKVTNNRAKRSEATGFLYLIAGAVGVIVGMITGNLDLAQTGIMVAAIAGLYFRE